MAELKEICCYIDDFLQVKKFRDYCPNGLQVQGRAQVRRILSGVTACQALIERAIAVDADAILVHHGYFWKGESAGLVGMKAQRVRLLLEAGISLLAYHLPLDAHPEVGNNAQLAKRLGFVLCGMLEDGHNPPLAMWGEPSAPMTPESLCRHIAASLDREPLWIDGGNGRIGKVGWCTGAAQDYIHYAIARGLDAFISGEISERTTHIAREEKIHYFAAGHHATERYGVQALGAHLCGRFSLQHHFHEINNPV